MNKMEREHVSLTKYSEISDVGVFLENIIEKMTQDEYLDAIREFRGSAEVQDYAHYAFCSACFEKDSNSKYSKFVHGICVKCENDSPQSIFIRDGGESKIVTNLFKKKTNFPQNWRTAYNNCMKADVAASKRQSWICATNPEIFVEFENESDLIIFQNNAMTYLRDLTFSKAITTGSSSTVSVSSGSASSGSPSTGSSSTVSVSIGSASSGSPSTGSSSTVSVSSGSASSGSPSTGSSSSEVSPTVGSGESQTTLRIIGVKGSEEINIERETEPEVYEQLRELEDMGVNWGERLSRLHLEMTQQLRYLLKDEPTLATKAASLGVRHYEQLDDLSKEHPELVAQIKEVIQSSDDADDEVEV